MLSLFINTNRENVRLLIDNESVPLKNCGRTNTKEAMVDLAKGEHLIRITTLADMAQSNWRRWLAVYWLNLFCGEIEVTCQDAMQNTIETDCEYKITLGEDDANITCEPEMHRLHTSPSMLVQKLSDTKKRSEAAWKRIMAFYIIPLFVIAIAIPLVASLASVYAFFRGVIWVGVLLAVIAVVLWFTVFLPAKKVLRDNLRFKESKV